jgi:hypothetical protein
MTFRDRYFEALGLLPEAEKDKDRRAAALERAHDIRKFEIELYWKRATYFWAFQAISFAALGLSIKDGEPHIRIAFLGAATLGAITGFTGWLTAKGSKFWQENWEAHVELLEEPAGEGRLTQVVITQGARPFSVGRVNQGLLALIALGWAGFLVVAACPWLTGRVKGLSEAHQASFSFGLVLFCGAWLFFAKRSRLAGRTLATGETNWASYPPDKRAKRVRLIWRDPVGGRPPSEGSSA